MPTEAKAEAWHDVIPAMLRARAVPFQQLNKADGKWRPFIATGPGPAIDNAHWREVPDLDDPQGFGYALRVAYDSGGASIDLLMAPYWRAVLTRHLEGNTTDDDRVAVARVLRGVA